MIDRLKIENFKCFSELSMEFRPFTLLCGVNSSGKSSVIQALLLGMEIAADKKAEGNLDLMDAKYNIDLYSFKELLYEDAEEEYIQISLYEDNVWNLWEFTSIDGDNNLLYKRKEGKEEALQKKVWYLGSERMISKYQRRGNAENLTLGKENEYIAYILECGRSLKIMIDKERSYQDQENLLFSAQVNQWLQYILPGSQVMASTTGNDNMVSLSFGKDFRFHRTNVGYGVGFVLPIIVGGLLAAKDDLLIIENPELHLHPRAQSDLALFLAFVANAGVQVLVETHSDHIINGLRKAVIGQECKIQAKEVGIYYFDKENRAEFLELDADAQFHTWPEDFMEQVEKDLYYLRKMRLANYKELVFDDKIEDSIEHLEAGFVYRRKEILYHLYCIEKEIPALLLKYGPMDNQTLGSKMSIPCSPERSRKTVKIELTKQTDQAELVCEMHTKMKKIGTRPPDRIYFCARVPKGITIDGKNIEEKSYIYKITKHAGFSKKKK